MSVKIERSGLIVREILDYDTDEIGEVAFYISLTRKEESSEIHDRHGNLVFHTINLTFEGKVAFAGENFGEPKSTSIEFSASVDPLRNKISLTGGNVMIGNYSLHGYRIGTYIMNEIVRRAKQWPQAEIDQISISEVDAKTDIDRFRRNRFYEQFNIPFDYTTPENRSGRSKSITAENLEAVKTWESNIEVLTESQLLLYLVNESNRAKAKLDSEKSKSEFLEERLKKIDDNPMVYALEFLFFKYLNYIALVIIALIFGSNFIWFKVQ